MIIAWLQVECFWANIGNKNRLISERLKGEERKSRAETKVACTGSAGDAPPSLFDPYRAELLGLDQALRSLSPDAEPRGSSGRGSKNRGVLDEFGRQREGVP